MNPKIFALLVFMVSVVMIFGSLSSAYLVKKSDGDWIFIDFPVMFQYTSIIIVLSIISMHWAYLSTKKNDLEKVKLGLLVTGILALLFTGGQYLGWQELIQDGHHFAADHPAGSFIYVFTGLHIAHLGGGLLYLGIVLYNVFQFKVHSMKRLKIELCTIYWHFLGGLWLYLYLFLISNN